MKQIAVVLMGIVLAGCCTVANESRPRVAVFGGSFSVIEPSKVAKAEWCRRAGIEYDDYGVSAAGFIARGLGGTNSIPEQIDRALASGKDYEAFVLWASTNDIWGEDKIKKQNSVIAECVEKLRKSRPQSKILFMTSMPIPLKGETRLMDYAAGQASTCRWLNVPVLEQHRLVVFPTEGTESYFWGDKLHPNEKGYAYVARLQANFLLQNLNPRKWMGYERGLVFAHRGGRSEFEENTMDAFRDSYAAGSRGFETDIRRTQDGEYVILHDDQMDRMYNGSGSVETNTFETIKAITTKLSGQTFCTLNDLLAFLSDKPGTYCEFEMKTGNRNLYPDAAIPAYCDGLYEKVMKAKPEGSCYAFTSFDERPLRYLRAKDPDCELMLITGGSLDDKFLDKATDVGVNRVAARKDVTTRNQVREAHNRGFVVTLWPGNSVADYLLAVGLEADAICSDHPVLVNGWKNAHMNDR